MEQVVLRDGSSKQTWVLEDGGPASNSMAVVSHVFACLKCNWHVECSQTEVDNSLEILISSGNFEVRKSRLHELIDIDAILITRLDLSEVVD